MSGATTPAMTYEKRRSELEQYFDRTAAAAWARLTSDAPVSGIRATVRQGRDEMRNTLLSFLPTDLSGKRVLDAGCGTGALAVELARRGAEVVAIDLAASLVNVAAERLPADLGPGSVEFRVGDMFDPALGIFDHVVAMDSVIHYVAPDMANVIKGFAARARVSVAFTFAPQTPFLAIALPLGKLFPRSDRSPAIEPVRPAHIGRRLTEAGLKLGRTHRVSRSFYTSQALEVLRA
jgi:magnesium-protoporphyrin O-methyltransferase